MSGIFGHIGLDDTERVFNATVGQRVIWEAASDYINRANQELNEALGIFVERTTSDFKLRYKQAGGGYLQKRGPDGRYGAVKATGYWDVAFPLEDVGAMIVGNDVAMAYMTAAELENHINTVIAQNVNTVRWHILYRIFNNTTDTFSDPIHGDLTIQPLANGDSVVYPAIIGATAGATDDHYLQSGYAETAIDDTNDPYPVIVAELEEHFGMVSGGSNIVTFINETARAETEALTDFFPIPDSYIRLGSNTDVPERLPMVPGRVIGRHKGGTWVSVWNYVPTLYAVGVHLEAEAPLVKRVDPADTGLGQDLQLVYQNKEFPFEESIWRHRFGIGTGNRLNGVVMEFGTDGSYGIPAAYQ